MACLYGLEGLGFRVVGFSVYSLGFGVRAFTFLVIRR